MYLFGSLDDLPDVTHKFSEDQSACGCTCQMIAHHMQMFPAIVLF